VLSYDEPSHMRTPLQKLCATLLLAILVSCSSDEPGRDPLLEATRDYNVVVVLLDAAAAGHFPFLGYVRDTAPNLARIAQESVVFEAAYAQASATPLSVLSLFTSRYPILEGTPEVQGEFGPTLPDQIPSMPHLVAPRFPQRVGFSANHWISDDFGYGPGFTEFHELTKVENDGVPGRANIVSDEVLSWLDRREDGQFFAYVHYYQPHAPYLPPEPHWSRFDPQMRGFIDATGSDLKPYREAIPPENIARNTVALYDGNISFVDEHVERVVRELQDRGLWDKTIFILLSDHGEAFWQHGSRGHGLRAYEEFIRVPLFIRIPGLSESSRRIQTPVELIDVLPTILDLADIPVGDSGLRGKSLVPLLVHGDRLDAAPTAVYSRNHQVSQLELVMRMGRFKMIQQMDTRQIMLFDLANDPMERVDLFDPATPEAEAYQLVRAMAIKLQVWIDDTKASWSSVVPTAPDSLDAEAIERLKAMGYLN